MIDISENIIADVDINLAAALLMLGVLVMTLRRNAAQGKSGRVYRYLAWATLAMALSGLAVEFAEASSEARVIAIILETILELSINMMLLFWFLYAFFVMYDSYDYFKRKIKLYMIPVVILVVVDIINMFTGIIWYYDENMVYCETTMYDLYDLLRYTYLLMSIYQYIVFTKENGEMRFFSIWPFIVPIVWGSMVEWVTPTAGFTLGGAIGITLLLILSSAKVSFTDEESGFFNSLYLNNIHDRVRQGEREPHLIISYSMPEGYDIKVFSDRLRQILPEKCDTVRNGPNDFITIVYGQTKGLAAMLKEDMALMAEELNIELKPRAITKKKKETPVEFFENNVKIGG